MIELQNLTLSRRGLPVVRGATLAINRGEVVILTGDTGSGKTSLIRALYGDLAIDDGDVVVNGVRMRTLPARKLPKLRRGMGLIFQDDKLLADRSVYDNLRFALSIQMDDPQEITRKALSILTELGLSHLRSSMPHELSAGESQRIGVGRALANDPAIILADEPTGDLDAGTAAEIFRFLARRCAPDRAILIATHDPARAHEAFPGARRWHLEQAVIREEMPAAGAPQAEPAPQP